MQANLIDGPRLEPKEKIKKLVIFLHGYGSDGNDLISLTEYFYKTLPNTAFVSPNAPSPVAGYGPGFEWFPLSTLSYEEKLEGTKASAHYLIDFIEAQKEKYGIREKDIALIGFSQGTMMSLYVAPRLKGALGCVIGFSGALTALEELANETTSRPPILLIHGDQDDVVPHKHLGEAKLHLERAQFKVETHTSAGIGHGIAPDGIAKAKAFLETYLKD